MTTREICERLRWHESQREWHQRKIDYLRRLIAEARVSRVLRKETA